MARVKGSTPLYELARAAIRMAEAVDQNLNAQAMVEYSSELREASIAYRNTLSKHDIERIGFGMKTLPR